MFSGKLVVHLKFRIDKRSMANLAWLTFLVCVLSFSMYSQGFFLHQREVEVSSFHFLPAIKFLNIQFIVYFINFLYPALNYNAFHCIISFIAILSFQNEFICASLALNTLQYFPIFNL